MFTDTASYYLEKAIVMAPTDAQPLVDALYWQETSLYLEKDDPNLLMLKNAGLGDYSDYLVWIFIVDFIWNLLRGVFENLKKSFLILF